MTENQHYRRRYRPQHPPIDNLTTSNNLTPTVVRIIKRYYSNDPDDDDDNDDDTRNIHPQQRWQKLQLLLLHAMEEEKEHYQEDYRYNTTNAHNNWNDYGLLDMLYYYCFISLLFSISILLAFLTYHGILYPYLICPPSNAVQYYPIHFDYTTTVTATSTTITSTPLSSSITTSNSSNTASKSATSTITTTSMNIPTATIPIQLPLSHVDGIYRSSNPHSSYCYYIQIQLELPDSYSNRYYSSMFTIKYQLLHLPTILSNTQMIDGDDSHEKEMATLEKDQHPHHHCPPPTLVEPDLNSTRTTRRTIQPFSPPNLDSTSHNCSDQWNSVVVDDNDMILQPPVTEEDNTLDVSQGNHHPKESKDFSLPHHNNSYNITNRNHPMDSNRHTHQHINTVIPSSTTTTSTITTQTPRPSTSSSSSSSEEEKDRTIVVLDTITRSYRYPYRSPMTTWMMNLIYVLPYLINMAPSTSLLFSSKMNRKMIWESQIITDAIVHDYNISQQLYPLNTVVLEIHQPQTQAIGSNTNHHNSQLIEIIGGNVMIGPEYTKLQQFMMLDYYYTCSVTITMLISVIYYCIIHYIVFRRQRSSRHNYPSTQHFQRVDGSTDGPMEFDDVHNFDYMNDLHIDDDDNDSYNNCRGDHSTSDWIPLSENDSNSDSNHDTAGTSNIPTNDPQRYSNKMEFRRDDDDTDLFFDTIPFLLENDNLLSNDNDDKILSIRITDDDVIPNEECIIAKGDEMTTPTGLVNGPTATPSQHDTIPPVQCENEALQHPQPLPFQQLDTVDNNVTDSTAGAFPMDGAQSILLPSLTRTMDDHRTIAGDTKHRTSDTDSKSDVVIRIPVVETPTQNDTVVEEPVSGNDDRQTISSSGSFLKSSTTTATTRIHVPIPPPPPSLVSTDNRKSPPPTNHSDNNGNHNPTTMDTNGISMIKLLWTELQDRDRSTGLSSNKTATGTAGSAIDNNLVYTNSNNDDDSKTRGHDDINIRDDIYQEYPFLAIFLS